MSIMLVRHGEAVGSQGDDAARYLTYRGRTETRKVALALKERGILPTAIVTSPLVRAVQTAEILAHGLGFDGTLTTEPAFVPDGEPSIAVKRIPITAGLTMVVAHEPIVRLVAGILAQQPSFPAFKTSGLAMFEGTRVTLTLSPDSIG